MFGICSRQWVLIWDTAINMCVLLLLQASSCILFFHRVKLASEDNDGDDDSLFTCTASLWHLMTGLVHQLPIS